MPPQKTTSGLLGKLGNRLRQAHDAHKGDTTVPESFNELPAGIVGGVAQLVDCQFKQIAAGKENAGEYMFFARGVAKRPLEHNGKRVAGLGTMISEPMYETPTRSRKTLDEHLDWIYKQLRGLGVDTNEVDIEDLESVAASLKEAKPHFKFHTWSGSKQEIVKTKDGKWTLVADGKPVLANGKPRIYATEEQAKKANPYAGREPLVNHRWNGLIEFSDEETNGEAGVHDATAAPEEDTVDETAVADDTAADEGSGDVGQSVEELVAIASGEETDESIEARNKLKELAMEAGNSEEEVDAAESWEAVGEMVTAVGDDSAAEEEGEEAAEEAAEEEAPTEPSKGEIYGLRLIDPKTKKPYKKPIEVEVVSVDKKGKTILATNLETKKQIKGIKWSLLLNEQGEAAFGS
jgi:hypothetical protein